MIVCHSKHVPIPLRLLDDDVCHDDVVFVPCQTLNADGSLDLTDVLEQLYHDHGIQTLMVEGGPKVLSAFLQAHLIDAVCLTISPSVFGLGLGITLSHPCILAGKHDNDESVHLFKFDNDICVVAFPCFLE